MSTVTSNKNSTSIKIPARIDKTVFKTLLPMVEALKSLEKGSVYDQRRENIRKNVILRKELLKLKRDQENTTVKIEKNDTKLKNREFDSKGLKIDEKLIKPFAVPQQLEERIIVDELKSIKKSSIHDQQIENIRKNEILRRESSKLKRDQEKTTVKIEKYVAKLKNAEFESKDLKKESKKLIKPLAVSQQLKERINDNELKSVKKGSIYDQQRENIRKNEILRRELLKPKSGQENAKLKDEKIDLKDDMISREGKRKLIFNKNPKPKRQKI